MDLMKGIHCKILIVLLVFANQAISQKNPGVLKGRLIDSTMQLGAKSATVSVLNVQDSSLVSYGLSNDEGSFEISGIASGNYIVHITFMGYVPVTMNFSILPEASVYDMATIYLEKDAVVLEGVVVKSAPIVIKGDTTEFVASHFKTIQNASTEDLLKKLPGVEVDRDGSIRTQGETVTRILVDGKRFFDDDPKMATRNLPADIIEKIQIIDALSDQSAFSGFDDGNRVRTINIITKKDRKKGLFGKGSIAIGNESRSAYAVSANRIDGDQKISFIGQRNNINNQNFSIQDFLGSMDQGGSGRNNGGKGGGTNVYNGNASGISTTTGGGINFTDAFGESTEFNGSYFYSNVNSVNNRDRYRETFVANDSSLFNTNNLLSTNGNENHRARLNIDHIFDTLNSIVVSSTYSHQETNSSGETRSATTKGKFTSLNEVYSINTSKNFGFNLTNSILFRHKFKKRGRTFSLNVVHGANTNERYGVNVSYNSRANRGIDTLDQVSSTLIDGKSIAANFSYTEPLNTRAQLELTYNYNYNHNNSDQQTYKLDKATGEHTIAVPNLINLFENSNASHRGGVNYKMQISRELNYSLGVAVQYSDLVSNNLSTSTFLNQSFINFFPNLSIQFKQGRSKNLRFIYRGSSRQPAITQLQDVINNTNILNIRSGNPSLKQEFSNNVTLSYNVFNIKNFKNLFITLNAVAISNKISNTNIINTSKDSMLVDGYYLIPGAQFSKPRNLNGAFNVSTNVNYNFSLKNPRASINLNSRFSYNRDVNLFNNEKSFTHNYIIGGSARLTMNFKEWVDLNFTSSSTYNIASYSSQNRQSGNFFNHRFSFEPTFTTKSGWIFSNDFDYLINRGQSAGFDQSIPLWNSGVAKLFMKNRLGELRFTVFDLLNANTSLTRNVEQNYTEDVRTDVLNRYFLISFTYHLRKFKATPGKKRFPGRNDDK